MPWKFNPFTGTMDYYEADTDTNYEPLTNGDTGTPELIFSDGDVVMVEMED